MLTVQSEYPGFCIKAVPVPAEAVKLFLLLSKSVSFHSPVPVPTAVKFSSTAVSALPPAAAEVKRTELVF